MSYRALIIAAVALAAGACERPTAPEARDMARELEVEAGNGDFTRIRRMLPLAEPDGFLQGSRIVNGNRALSVSRNGLIDTISGFVLENVYLPPAGYGTPVIRRSIVGFDDAWQYGFVGIAEQHPGNVGRNNLPHGGIPAFDPSAFLKVYRHDPGASWVALGGVVDIREPVLDRDCEFGTESLGWSELRVSKVTCQRALYEVKVEGEFLKQSDFDNPLFASTAPRQRLEIPAQKVPGVRFTTQCPEFSTHRDTLLTPVDIGDPCFGNWYRYWRDNRLFNEKLGVDIRQMRIAPGGMWYSRVLSQLDKREGPSAPYTVRWTIHTPDGTLIQSDSAKPGLMGENEDLLRAPTTYLGQIAVPSRMQAVIPARDLGLLRSHYAMVVVHVDITSR